MVRYLLFILILTLSASAERKAIDDIYDNGEPIDFKDAKVSNNKDYQLKPLELSFVFSDKKQHLFTKLPKGWVTKHKLKFYQPRAKDKTLSIEIVKSGYVLILISDNWDVPNDKKKFVKEWKHVSHVETSLFDATVYMKYCNAGEKLNISNHRYNPPILLRTGT